MGRKAKLSLSNITKKNIWTFDEQELYQILRDAKKDDSYAENEARYNNIIRLVFDVQYLNREDVNKVTMLESQKYIIFNIPNQNENGNVNNAVAIRKRRLRKITDLTLENIQHLEAAEVLELIKNNMDTGWNGLPLQQQDIINSAFYVDTTALPEAVLHRPGGIVERRKADGYDVLELVRGNWIEAIFLKPKPKYEKVHFNAGPSFGDSDDNSDMDDEEMDDENDDIDDDNDIDNDDLEDDDDDNVQTESLEDIVDDDSLTRLVDDDVDGDDYDE